MKKGIAVITGTFNPVQNAHINLGEQVLNKFSNIIKIIYMPVGDKYIKKDLQDAEYRYQILKAVCDVRQNFEVSRVEIENKDKLFTYQTLDILKKEYEKYDIYLVIGSDNLKSFYTWKKFEYILENYKIIVFSRGEDNFENIIAKNTYLSKYLDNISLVTQNDFLNVSSTEVRKNIKNGKSYKHLLPKEAYEYIISDNRYEKESLV